MSGRVLGFAALAVAALGAVGTAGFLAGRTAAPPASTTTASTPAATPDPVAPAQAAPVSSEAPAVHETEEEVEAPANPTPVVTRARVPVESGSAPVERATAARKATAADRPVATPSSKSGSTKSGPAAASPRVPVVTRNEAPRPLPPEVGEALPAPAPVPATPAPASAAAERPAPPVPPPAPKFEEFVIPVDAVLGLQLEDTVSSDSARVEQRVEARVSRDLHVNGTIVIPAGARATGEVTVVEPGGKFRERGRLGIRFHTLVLGDGTSVPIETDTIYREGEAVGTRSAARIGGSAVGGAIIGAIFGGGKGAAIGAAAGAGAGTAATMASGKSQAMFRAGSTVTVRLTRPASVSVEREN